MSHKNRVKQTQINTSLGLTLIFVFALLSFYVVSSFTAKVEAAVVLLEAKTTPPAKENFLKRQLLYEIGQYQIAPENIRSEKLNKVNQTAKLRTRYLNRLIQDKSQKIHQAVLSYDFLQQLELPVKENLEASFNAEVTIHTIHGDNFENNQTSEEISLSTNQGELLQALLPTFINTKRKPTLARVTGVKIGNTVIVQEVNSVSKSETITANQPILGQRKVGIVLFNFQDDQSQPVLLTAALQKVFTDTNSVRAYYNEVSNTQINLVGKNNANGDVYGYYTIPLNKTDCSLINWSNAARALAESSGADLSGYDHLVYVFPYSLSCGFGGWADVGGSRFWINGSDQFNVKIIGHELGHNLNFVHASSYSCTSGGQSVSISDTCTAAEYGDLFDIMGTSTRHLHVGRKSFVGWIAQADTIELSAAGTYSLELKPMEQSGVTPRAIRIPFAYDNNVATRYYYLEYRQPYGQYDNFSPSDPAVRGITIRVASKPELNNEANSLLIDTTPASSSFLDAALQVGNTFTDSSRGVSVSLTQVTSSSASVSITLTCVRKPPAVTPMVYNNYGKSGDSKEYKFNIKNDDSSACAPSNLQLEPNTAPLAGWSQTPASSLLTLAAGGSAEINFSITSALTSPQGLYIIVEKITNTASNLFSTKNLFYRVDNTSPVVSFGYLPYQINQGDTIPISGSATDNEEVYTLEFFVDSNLIFSCFLPSGVTTCQTFWTASNLSGLHNISIKATDKASNSAVDSRGIQINTFTSGRTKIKVEQ